MTMAFRTLCFMAMIFVDGPMRWVLFAGAVMLPTRRRIMANQVNQRPRSRKRADAGETRREDASPGGRRRDLRHVPMGTTRTRAKSPEPGCLTQRSCASPGCRELAAYDLAWNNPKIHPAERRALAGLRRAPGRAERFLSAAASCATFEASRAYPPMADIGRPVAGSWVVDAVSGLLAATAATHRQASSCRRPRPQRRAQVGLVRANRQLRTLPVGGQPHPVTGPQNGFDTEAMMPTRSRCRHHPEQLGGALPRSRRVLLVLDQLDRRPAGPGSSGGDDLAPSPAVLGIERNRSMNRSCTPSAMAQAPGSAPVVIEPVQQHRVDLTGRRRAVRRRASRPARRAAGGAGPGERRCPGQGVERDVDPVQAGARRVRRPSAPARCRWW